MGTGKMQQCSRTFYSDKQALLKFNDQKVNAPTQTSGSERMDVIRHNPKIH